MAFSKEDIPVLDAAGLRKFGFTVGGIFIALFGLLLPWWKTRPVPEWPFIVGALFLVPAVVAPSSLKPVHWAWMRVGLVLGAINTRIILGAFYALLVIPVAVLFKVTRRDVMRRAHDKAAATYRVASVERDPSTMEQPF